MTLHFRHNVMRLNTMENFVNIRGGQNQGIRDVYFVRVLGENDTFIREVHRMEEELNRESSLKRVTFQRVTSLSRVMDPGESQYYASVCDGLNETSEIQLKTIRNVNGLYDAIKTAAEQIRSIYKASRPDVTESILKSMLVKFLYRLDTNFEECFHDWNERKIIKIISDNVMKEQEYLFYLFLTFLGCDVLLIQNRSDVTAAPSLLEYSDSIVLGKYGKTILPSYRNTEVVSQSKTVHTGDHHPQNEAEEKIAEQPVRVKIPPRRATRKQEPLPSAATTVKKPQRKRGSTKKEKSYEELAQLASSVVLIAVHDQTGKILGTGSGIMIGKQGYILTNFHVISGGSFFSVRIEDEEDAYQTRDIIKYNSLLDLALIRIGKKIKPIPIHKGKQLVRGQKVVAIGSPLGLFNSVSDGIISGFRIIDEVDMIQFTAPISHGSSGGALLNLSGELIGMSTAGIDEGQNLNLAIGFEHINDFVRGFL